MGNERRGRAIVIGGSIVGLSVARVLSRHYGRVTVVERDRLPDGPQHRSGVPQSHHGHGLLLRGLQELNRLFPGFEDAFMAQGAHRVDLGAEFGHYSEWGWSPRQPTGVVPVAGSRLGIESTLRKLALAQIDNLELRDGTRVRDLVTTRDAGAPAVVGVRVDGPAGAETLHGDLVVDASGKNGKVLAWLDQLGLPRPPEEVVDSHSAYASRFYRLPTPRPREWWWKGLLIDAKPPDERRWAMLLPCEGDELVLILAGVNGCHPPTDEAGYEAYMRALRTPYLAQVISRCEPISSIHGNQPLMNRWRHFERWRGRLDNYICMGDTLCTFNPLHGQGITTGVVSAVNLEHVLARLGPDGRELPGAFYEHHAAFLAQPWRIATSLDLQWPETTGQRHWLQRLAWPLARAFGRSIHEDPVLKYYLGRSFHLIDGPEVMKRPRVLYRIFRTTARRALRGPSLPAGYDPMCLPAEAGDEGSALPTRDASQMTDVL